MDVDAQLARRSRWRRFGRLCLIVAVIGIGLLLIERWRGQWALRSWKREMEAKGEVFDAERFWPAKSEAAVEFSNQLARAVAQLPFEFRVYGSRMSGMVHAGGGQARRGSQELLPLAAGEGGPTNSISWQQLDGAVEWAEPALASLRQLIKNPPQGVAFRVAEVLEHNSFPSFVPGRMAAYGLQTAAISDLHGGDLPRALEDLVALCELGKIYASDPSLVSCMMHVAIIGVSVPACWDALQADGWTDQQLAALQHACRDDTILPALARALEAERIGHGYELNWFRTHSRAEWLDRWQQVYNSFGPATAGQQPARPVRWWEWPLGRLVVKGGQVQPADSAQLWQIWIFRPTWRFAWADQEALEDLRRFQPDLEAFRQVRSKGSWVWLDQQLTANRKAYRRPLAAWRFYFKLPLADEFGQNGAAPPQVTQYPYQDFSRAWAIAFKNLTLREMVITAASIKRYQLRLGKLPGSLAALQPEFLERDPRDFMDGQSLRYRLNSDGSFTLYSVGADGRDDGGVIGSEQATEAPWGGRDWIWPRVMQN
jgi:hypothetical protein